MFYRLVLRARRTRDRNLSPFLSLLLSQAYDCYVVLWSAEWTGRNR